MSAQIDKPIAGFYKTKLVKGGPWVPVCIWFGAPLDPDTLEPLDRSHRWNAIRDNRLVDIDRVWPSVYGHEISEEDYRLMLALATHARKHDPQQPIANPRKRIDFLTVKPPTGGKLK